MDQSLGSPDLINPLYSVPSILPSTMHTSSGKEHMTSKGNTSHFLKASTADQIQFDNLIPGTLHTLFLILTVTP